MRFASVRTGGALRGARVDGDRLVVLNVPDALGAASAGPGAREVADLPLAEADLAPVSPAPQHVLCIGLNQRHHIEQLGLPVPEYPTFFAKFASTLTGARDAIALPSISRRIQGEVELAVVLGRTARRLRPEEARVAIAGWTVANDLSLRDWQHRTSEALQGKVADRTTPVGPFLVTPEEADPADGLAMSTAVDGVQWQTGSTADLVFDVAALVSYCSTFLTLRPGDLILTGTPGTTAAAGDLAPGSTMTTSIEGIGAAVNPLVAEAP